MISDSRLCDCVETLLLMQNSDGGFGDYERIRAGPWLERLNPSESFDRTMVAYSYPECTTAVLTSLALFRQHFPHYHANEIEATISRAVDYIRATQRPDGSWEGSWGICFTYALFFAMDALETVHETYQCSVHVRKGCDWLLSKQRADGGWGEDWSSCEKREYVQHWESQVVNTAWAVLALMSARCPQKENIEGGIKLIESRQQSTGEWIQEDAEGVFGRACTIGYPNYKFYFSIRALGKYEHVYLPWLSEFDSSKAMI